MVKLQSGGNRKQMGVAITSVEDIKVGILDWFAKFKNDPTWQRCIIKYTVMTAVLIGVSILMLKIINNTSTTMYNVEKYFFVIAFPLVLIFALLLNLNTDQTGLYTFVKIGSVLLLLAIGLYYYSLSTGNGFIYSTFTNYTVLAVIILIALMLLYSVIVKSMSRWTGVAGFIAQLIFYIPCILWDLWTYLFQQFQMTPWSVYGLLLLELILIVIYMYLPTMTNTVTGIKDGTQLMTNIYWLNQPAKVIATSEMLLSKPTTAQALNGQNGQYRTNYCISMWVYVNPQNASSAAYSQETELFRYGYTDASGVQHVKPMIRYYGGGNDTDQLVERNKYVFYFANYPPTDQYASTGDTMYDVSLPNQKWNQIVLNYNRNVVDLFINGNLERSFAMENTIPMYSPLDTITVGSANGVQGAICNVAFYNHPLSTEQIAFSYNTLAFSNPPIPRNPAKTPQLGTPATG